MNLAFKVQNLYGQVELCDHALRAFHEAFSLQLGESYAEERENIDKYLDVHAPQSVDDSYYLEDSNDIKFDCFEE